MDKKELIEELKKEIEVIRNNTDWEEHVETYEKGKRIGLEIGWMLADQLDEPEIAEEQAWEVIGEAYADSEKGRLMNAKKIFDNGLKMQGIINTVVFELNKNNDKRTFEEFILDSIKETEKPVIPQFVADWIEKCKDREYNLFGVFDYAEGEVKEWIFNKGIKNKKINLVARAWLDGYTIEPPKTLQVIVKNYDSTVYKTEIPEDEAMKLIEGWKGR